MKATLPLPLQLTQPVELSSSLEDTLKESWAVETSKYNPETQVSEDAEGVPMILNGGTQSQTQYQSGGVLGLVNLDATDVTIDDNHVL